MRASQERPVTSRRPGSGGRNIGAASPRTAWRTRPFANCPSSQSASPLIISPVRSFARVDEAPPLLGPIHKAFGQSSSHHLRGGNGVQQRQGGRSQGSLTIGRRSRSSPNNSMTASPTQKREARGAECVALASVCFASALRREVAVNGAPEPAPAPNFGIAVSAPRRFENGHRCGVPLRQRLCERASLPWFY